MRNRNSQEVEHATTGEESRSLFLGTFPAGHEPKIDNRTPNAVASGLSPQEWRELNG